MATGQVVTHLAGPVIDYNHELGVVTRQRCSWCGAVLVDECDWLIAVPVGQDPRVPGWKAGAFIDWHHPDGQGGWGGENPWTEGPIPETACLRMPLELTA